MFLETSRVVLRRVTPDDAEALVELDSDPLVVRFTGGRSSSPETVRDDIIPRWLTYYDRFPAFGFWIAIEKATGAFLGWFHFRPDPDGVEDGVELGYRLRRAAWGHGYGTEVSAALVRRGFGELGVRRIYAHADEANRASWRVMEKVGLRYVRTFDDDGVPVVEYALDRADWSGEQ